MSDLAKKKSLIARMAGNIACGVVSNPSWDGWDSEKIARFSVELAQEIVEKVDKLEVEEPAEK